MGRPKPLLRIGTVTFLERILSLYPELGFCKVIVLSENLCEAVAGLNLGNGRVLFNPDPDQGPLSSLRIGLAALENEVSGIIVHPVDHPMVARETAAALIREHTVHPGAILLPENEGKTGHPVLFPEACFDALHRAPLNSGARYVVEEYAERVIRVPVADPGIHQNVDTPADYRRWVESA